MDFNCITEDPKVLEALTELGTREYSDIVDAAGRQYVDLVMEGGGMLGLALVGYTWALERAGIRFLGIAGTSAGSINALLLASLGAPEEAKSPTIADKLAGMNFLEFLDGDADSRDLIKTWIASQKGQGKKPGKVKRFFVKAKLAFKALQVLDTLGGRMGLNPGTAFQDWLSKTLAEHDIATLSDLQRKMSCLPPGLRHRSGTPFMTMQEAGAELAIIAADVSTETKAILPKNAGLYFERPADVNPAVFARASMSIPLFFEPLCVGPLPTDAGATHRWLEEAGIDMTQPSNRIPERALFVDGGIISNFPIDVFHDYSKVPPAPTFGVKLEYDCRCHDIRGVSELVGAVFNSARHCMDFDFFRQHGEYKRLVTWIPCGGADWLDFGMDQPTKLSLFKGGVDQAIAFLQGFDWQEYKALRKKLLASNPSKE